MIVIKIILRVLLAVIILLAVALTIPVRLEAKYSDVLQLTVKYLFLKFPIDLENEEEEPAPKPNPKPNKKRSRNSATDKSKNKVVKQSVKTEQTQVSKTVETSAKKDSSKPKSNEKNSEKNYKTKTVKKTKKSKETKKVNPPKEGNPTLQRLREIVKERGLKGLLELFKELAKIATGLLKCLFKHIKIRRLDLNITVAFDNAADTAINYGYVCSGVYPALSILLNVMKFREYSVNIVPDFDKKQTEIDLDSELSIIPWFALVGAVEALIKFIKLKIKGIM